MVKINFEKYTDGLVPAVVQDSITLRVLMVGFMNQQALEKTLETNRVCFYSRSRNELWTKGETSGNYLNLVAITVDCDQDTLLIKAVPEGPVCHTGADTCFKEANANPLGFIGHLEQTIAARIADNNPKSYTVSLISKGINKVAQKLGEEAVELVIEAKDENPDLFLGEAADLLYHYLVLLQAKQFSLADVAAVLQKRHSLKK